MTLDYDRLKVVLLPLSISRTLHRHRLIAEDILSLNKIKDILPVSAIVDLVMVQTSIYQLLPTRCSSANNTGLTVADPLPKGVHIDPNVPLKKDDDEAYSVPYLTSLGQTFQFYQLDHHYNQTQSPPELEFYRSKVVPQVRSIGNDLDAMKQFYQRLFQKNLQQSYGELSAIPVNGSYRLYDDTTNEAFSINFVRENFAIVTYDERKFPDEENFHRLVLNLLEAKHSYSNYENMTKEMSDLFAYYLKSLDKKLI